MDYIKQLLFESGKRRPDLKPELEEIWELAHEEAEESISGAIDMVEQSIRELEDK